jgi:alkylation response protein AidB-like acyl-CoA dehydrogenase
MDEVLDREIVAAVRRFVERDVIPNASALEHRDEYPHAMVATMRELGLFGATIPTDFGGLGLSFLTYARVMEELSRGWMSLAGVINSHLIMAYVIANHGTDAQKKYFLPAMACGEKRGGLALTEPHAGSDVQSIRTAAVRRGDDYILTGSKMFITNARHGTMLAVAAKTNPNADPAYAGISMFAVEKSDRGPTVSRNLDKLGYQASDERARSRTHQRSRARSGSRAGRVRNRNPLLATTHGLRQTNLPASSRPIATRRHGHPSRGRTPAGRQRRTQKRRK